MLYFLNQDGKYESTRNFSNILAWVEPTDKSLQKKQEKLSPTPPKPSIRPKAETNVIDQVKTKVGNHVCTKLGDLIGTDSLQEINRLKSLGYDCRKL